MEEHAEHVSSARHLLGHLASLKLADGVQVKVQLFGYERGYGKQIIRSFDAGDQFAGQCSLHVPCASLDPFETLWRRAVATANATNPVAIVIPCHRVIHADGSISGYGGGVDRKKWLLRHEADNLPFVLGATIDVAPKPLHNEL